MSQPTSTRFASAVGRSRTALACLSGLTLAGCEVLPPNLLVSSLRRMNQTLPMA